MINRSKLAKLCKYNAQLSAIFVSCLTHKSFIMRLSNVIFSFLFLVSFFTYAQETYNVGSTEYYYNDYYSTTGKPKVKRSYANKMKFLRSYGYNSVPDGYEVDHIIPLSQGGSDSPYNMQLLTVEQHKAKTAREKSKTSSSSIYKFNSNYSTKTTTYDYSPPTYTLPSTPSFSMPSTSSSSTRVYQTGPRGGTYYINSNGNKTYVKK